MMIRTVVVIASTFLALSCSPHAEVTAPPPTPLDVAALWDFRDPELSEERFRAALESATGDDELILQTQIARTYALRRDFEKAREVLRSIEPRLETAGAEARVRYWLELGRTYASHRHPEDSQTDETRDLARAAYTRAVGIAREARLDGLTIDALHMLPFVETAPAERLRWEREALALVEASGQPAAKRWEASIRNNLGETLYDLEHYDEALIHFRRSMALREEEQNLRAARDAQWHIARVMRVQDRTDEALEIQLRLERESDDAGQPRPYIFEELELLYRALGDHERARHYADRAVALRSDR